MAFFNGMTDSLGNLITGTGLLRDLNNQTVSNYTGYGSYSGSDIKIIVHLPYNGKLEAFAHSEKAKYEKELLEHEQETESLRRGLNVLGEDFPEYKVAELEKSRTAIEAELDKADKFLNEIRNKPTSKVLGEVQTLSWSIFRDKAPVRPLGANYPRAYTRGARTISGSIVFTVFHKHALHEILSLNLGIYSTGTSDCDSYCDTTNLIDQLPPLDISLVFANEYGALSHMGLWGVEFFQEGGTFSVEDIYSENVVQYVARDLDPIRIAGVREINGQGVGPAWTRTATGLMYEEERLNGHLKRRNPFI